MLDRAKNPVLALELSKRYKSKAYIVSERIIYAFSLLCLFGSVVFFLFFGFEHPYPQYPYVSRSYERAVLLLEVMSLFAMALVFFVVPAFAATSIVGERRRGTLMLVQSSFLRPFDIVEGKVFASIVPILVPAGVYVLVRELSLLKVVAILGDWAGVSLAVPVVVGLAVNMFMALPIIFALSAISVLVSTFTKSSRVSIIVSYIIALIFLFIAHFLRYIPVDDIPLISRCCFKSYRGYYASHYVDDIPGIVSSHILLAVVFVCALGLSVWWACRRLRLPAKK